MDDDPKYSDSEFALIMRKAIELQEGPGRIGAGKGLSMREIQAIAAEIGLDSALVERAASLVPRTDDGLLVRASGGPSIYQMEYSTKGEVPREDLGRLVDTIRQVTTQQGEVTEVLGSLEWKSVGEVSQIHVTVASRDGLTSVRILANRAPAAVLTLMLPGVAGLFGIGIAGAIIEPTTVAGVLSIVATSLGSALLVSRTLWKTTTSTFRTRLHQLMGSLATTVDESVKPPQRP